MKSKGVLVAKCEGSTEILRGALASCVESKVIQDEILRPLRGTPCKMWGNSLKSLGVPLANGVESQVNS